MHLVQNLYIILVCCFFLVFICYFKICSSCSFNCDDYSYSRAAVDQVAIAIMDEKVGDRVNVLNSARYRTRQKQARLQDLQMQYKQLGGDDDDDDGETGGGGGGGRGSERAGSSGGGGGKRGNPDGKGDTAKSGDSKEDEEGQVIKLFSLENTYRPHRHDRTLTVKYEARNFTIRQKFKDGINFKMLIRSRPKRK